MLQAADPVHGSAASFDEERAVRKHIGDYALFVGGMYPEASGSSRRRRRHQPSLNELIHAGKESYYIVSQFNLFEYEQEAPLFARLADGFERCILGLTMVREEIGPKKTAVDAAAGELISRLLELLRIPNLLAMKLREGWALGLLHWLRSAPCPRSDPGYHDSVMN